MKKLIKNKKLWIAIGITIISLYFAVRNISFGDVIKAFKGIKPVWIIPSLILLFVGLWVRGLRWKVLFKNEIPYSTHDLFKLVMIGYMFNNLFPARLGEFVRIYILGKDKKLSKTLVFSTIFTERLFDVLSLLVFLAFFFLYLSWINFSNSKIGGLLGNVERVSTFLIPLIVLCFAIVFFWPDRVKRLIKILVVRIPRISRERADTISHAFMDGLEGFRNPSIALKTLLWSSVSWILITGSILMLIEGFGFHGRLSIDIAMALAVLIGVNMAMVLPATPGYVGIFEAAVVGSLLLFGISKESALAFAFLCHALNYFPVILLGWYFLMKDHLSLQDLAASASRRSMVAEEE